MPTMKYSRPDTNWPMDICVDHATQIGRDRAHLTREQFYMLEHTSPSQGEYAAKCAFEATQEVRDTFAETTPSQMRTLERNALDSYWDSHEQTQFADRDDWDEDKDSQIKRLVRQFTLGRITTRIPATEEEVAAVVAHLVKNWEVSPAYARRCVAEVTMPMA